MDKQKVLDLFNQEERIGPQEEYGFRREMTPEVVRFIGPDVHAAWVSYSRVDEGNVERVIGEQIDYFESIGQDFEWKVYSYDRPADLKERLAARGFEIGEMEAFAVLDLEQAGPDLFAPLRHDVRLIEDPARVADAIAVHNQVWDEDFSWMQNEMTGMMRDHPNQIRIYVAYADGIPVSSARIIFHLGTHFAGLFGGATLPAYRGQGIYRELVAARAQEARRRGVRYLTVDASPMSRPILEKLGFEVLAFTWPCTYTVRKDAQG